jgi:hypothetical protein
VFENKVLRGILKKKSLEIAGMNNLHEGKFVIWAINLVEDLNNKNWTSRIHENECRVWGQKYEMKPPLEET